MERRISDIKEFLNWKGEDAPTNAERRLLECSALGDVCFLNSGEVPLELTPDCEIRAELIRFLVANKDVNFKVDPVGIKVFGAYVIGVLNLDYLSFSGQFSFDSCNFEDEIHANYADFDLISLSGSRISGLIAQGIKIRGGLFLRDGLYSSKSIIIPAAKIDGVFDFSDSEIVANFSGAVFAEGATIGGGVFAKKVSTVGALNFTGATVKGQFTCDGARLRLGHPFALNAQGATVTGLFSLKGASTETPVHLSGLKLQGQLNCVGGTFVNPYGGIAFDIEDAELASNVLLRDQFHAVGGVRVSNSKIGGQLDFYRAKIEGDFDAEDATVSGGLLWREVEFGEGRINLAGANLSTLGDDFESYSHKHGKLVLDGLTFENITGGVVDVEKRLKWLEIGSYWEDRFFTQPYVQLASVYRSMGDDRSARAVLMEKHKRLTAMKIQADRVVIDRLWDGSTSGSQFDMQDSKGDIGWIWLRLKRTQFWDTILHALVGYGHAPERALWWTIGTVSCATVFYFLAFQMGGMVPSSAVILNSESWAISMVQNPEAPGVYWSHFTDVGKHYETFNSFAYAADVFVPIIDLGQERNWSATTATVFGSVAWVCSWGLKVFGWVVSAFGAAAISGIIKTNE